MLQKQVEALLRENERLRYTNEQQQSRSSTSRGSTPDLRREKSSLSSAGTEFTDDIMYAIVILFTISHCMKFKGSARFIFLHLVFLLEHAYNCFILSLYRDHANSMIIYIFYVSNSLKPNNSFFVCHKLYQGIY